jgi:hypothetical protein
MSHFNRRYDPFAAPQIASTRLIHSIIAYLLCVLVYLCVKGSIVVASCGFHRFWARIDLRPAARAILSCTTSADHEHAVRMASDAPDPSASRTSARQPPLLSPLLIAPDFQISIHKPPKVLLSELRAVLPGVDTSVVLVVPTAQKAGIDLLGLGEAVAAEKDRLLLRVRRCKMVLECVVFTILETYSMLVSCSSTAGLKRCENCCSQRTQVTGVISWTRVQGCRYACNPITMSRIDVSGSLTS